MRLIDADALIEDAIRIFQPDKFNHAYVRRRVIDLINNAPTVEEIQVCQSCDYMHDIKHGHWIDHETEDGIMLGRDCSVCGAWLVLDSDFNFCPECGAKMDEVNE